MMQTLQAAKNCTTQQQDRQDQPGEQRCDVALLMIEAPGNSRRGNRRRLTCDSCNKTYQYQHTCRMPQVRCGQCGRQYKNRHTCFGPGHRSQLARLGFWTNDEEQSLFQYYITKLCKGRTLFTNDKRNSYLNLVRSTPSVGVNAAVYGLASLYLGRQEGEIKYISRALNALRDLVKKPGTVGSITQIIQIIQLLVHYQVVTRQGGRGWSIHAKAIARLQERVSINYDPFLFVAYESILQVTAPDDESANDGISVEFLLECESPEEVLDFGCSRELLYLLGEINVQEKCTRENPESRVSVGEHLLGYCRRITQRVNEQNDDRRQAIEKISQSYLMMAQVVIYCRLLGYTRHNATLQAVCERLTSLVLGIPTDGDWFNAQYPLAPVFWGMLFTTEKGEVCGNLLRGLCSGKPTNTTRALDTADAIRRYHKPTGDQETGWFEKMLIELGIKELSLG